MSDFFYLTPVFLITIATDSIISYFEGRDIYTSKDTLSNLIIGTLGVLTDLLVKGIAMVVFYFFFQYADPISSNGILYWTCLFLLQDFALFVLHYSEHKIRFLWASHFIHHSSGKLNFSTSVRLSVFQPFYRFVFYLPLVFLGFDPLHLLLVHSLSKTYVFFLHTERVGKLGFLEYFMNTPSHHRVHHAVNPCYIDKNMGNVLIIWDRIFGTFAEEKEKVRFGTTKKPEKDDFLSHLFFEWKRLGTDLRKERNLRNKIRIVLRMN